MSRFGRNPKDRFSGDLTDINTFLRHRLGIRQVRSESSLCILMVANDFSFLSLDNASSDQTEGPILAYADLYIRGRSNIFSAV